MASPDRYQQKENKSVWNSTLARAGLLLIAAGYGLTALKMPGASAAFQFGLIALTGGFAWNWAFGKGGK